MNTSLVDQVVKNRQQKGRGLAATCHGAGEDVAASDGGWDRVALDRCRAGEAELFDAFEQAGMQLQTTERHHGS